MERLGRFLLLQKIGSGGMAEVYMARPADATISKLVAIKRMLPQYMHDTAFAAMFRHEAEIAIKLRHPSIIMAHEFCTSENQTYMSMEYFPGKSLSTIMVKLREHELAMDLPEILFIVRNIAAALQHIHDYADDGGLVEIVHRDISPQNIMLGLTGTAKLIDFGVAKASRPGAQGSSKIFKGKMAYMSPEQAVGGEISNQTDLFSLGIVMWELLAGRKLFTGETTDEVAHKVATCKIPSIKKYVPDLPRQIDSILKKALAKKREDRYPNATVMIRDLNKVLDKISNGKERTRIARVLNQLFPEEVAELKRTLKTYEGQITDTKEYVLEDSEADSRPPLKYDPDASVRHLQAPIIAVAKPGSKESVNENQSRSNFLPIALAFAGAAFIAFGVWQISTSNNPLNTIGKILKIEMSSTVPER